MLLFGIRMLVGPHPSQQHANLQQSPLTSTGSNYAKLPRVWSPKNAKRCSLRGNFKEVLNGIDDQQEREKWYCEKAAVSNVFNGQWSVSSNPTSVRQKNSTL